MNDLLSAVVSPDVSIRPCSMQGEGGERTWHVGNGLPSEAPASAFYHLQGERIEVPSVRGLAISANWRFIPNSTGQWIKVDWSQFGLWCLNREGEYSPALRMEVDPRKEGWARAHINVTGESMVLGHVFGLQGKPYRRLQQIPIPVGGFAYRPCLEDFLEFAIDEKLIPPLTGEWRDAVNQHRADYHAKQLRSLVGKYPDVARAALEEIGVSWD